MSLNANLTFKKERSRLSNVQISDKIVGEQEEQITKDTSEGQIIAKRGRGRPRKNPCIISLNADMTYKKERVVISGVRTTDKSVEEKDTKINKESFDLLESCLKESGIKAIGEKVNYQEKDGEAHNSGNTLNELDNVEDEDAIDVVKEEEMPEESSTVFVCDSVESISNVNKRKVSSAKHKCQDCGKMYASASILKCHRVRHLKKEDLPFSCKTCTFRCASKIELIRHNLKHESSITFKCKLCDKTFARDTGLREHIDCVHDKARTLKCAVCNFSTYRLSTMRNHMKMHEGAMTPVIACPICSVTFKSKTSLKTHLYSHAGVKKFVCEICDKKYISQNRLKVHKLQVHGPREHGCSLCDMKFPTHHALIRHMLVHTGEKPFQCCFCSFSCNTHGNLLKHIRQMHEKINFTYKDFLKESKKEQVKQSLDVKILEEMQNKGKDFAQKLLNNIGDSIGKSLSLEKLKEEVQKKEQSKVAAFQEQLSKRKKRVQKKTLISTHGKERKITVYSLPDKSGILENTVDETVYTDSALTGLNDDNPCWLTHTDQNGCVMLIPWDVSLISENDEGEEGEWNEELQTDKMVKVTSTCGDVAVKVTQNKDTSIVNVGDECNDGALESALEISHDIKENKIRNNIEMNNGIMQVTDLSEVVDKFEPLNMDITIEEASCGNLSLEKKSCKQLPKVIQVITTNNSMNNTSQNLTNIVLPQGYIVDGEGQVLQLTENVIDTNLLQLQMGENVSSNEAQEVTINKIPNGVYSFINQNNSGKEDTYIISESAVDNNSIKNYISNKHKRFSPEVNMLSVEGSEEEGDQQSALVLIVDAEDVDNC